MPEKKETEIPELEKAEVPEIKKKEMPIIVVKELPVQQVNTGITDKGEEVRLITIEDAITEMYLDIKEIKKAVA